MIGLVLVDTNVFVYAQDASEPAKRARARDWIGMLWREQRGRTSIQILSEYFSVVTRKTRLGVSPENAWEDIQMFMRWMPQAQDAELLTRTYALVGRFQLDWWDCLVIAAAQAQACTLILTEDLQDGADYDGIVARNPFKLDVAEEHMAYAAVPRVASRHRGRGRPRKRPQRASNSPT
jgi:predicted nucleic acid-binding protein